MVGIAQLVSAPDCGSGGQGFESLYPPFITLGLSPSGKAQDFDSCISLVRIQLALLEGQRFSTKKINIWDISSGGRALDF